VFFTVVFATLHRLFQFLLAIGKQSMDLTMCLVADCVNLRAEFLTRRIRIFVEQRLNLVVVLLKQRPDFLLLFRSQLQVARKTRQLLVDRLRCIESLELLPC